MSTTYNNTTERIPAQDSGEITAKLMGLVQKHAACYEVWPEWALDGGRRVKIGFELRLCGANAHCAGHDGCQPVPGCHVCQRTYKDLKEVAGWMLPSEKRASRYEIQTFDRGLHVAPKGRGTRSEVVLSVKILHRHEVNDPVDDCEELCLKEMRRKLAELGVREGNLPKAASQTA